MSDENINPQNIPIQPPENSLVENKSSFLKSKKIIFIILLSILIVGIPISFFFFFDSAKLIKPPVVIPTDIPKTTNMPLPTQKIGEFLTTIKLGETITIPNTSISLTYKSADIPGDNCYDCVASNTLEVKMNEQIKTLNYSCGGITGGCIAKQDAFGYEIEIIDSLNRDTLKLKIIMK